MKSMILAASVSILLLLGGCQRPSAEKQGDETAGLGDSPELEFAYAIEVADDQATDGVRRVPAEYRFHSGDRFRIAVRSGFAAHVYLFNRDSEDDSYRMLFPRGEIGVANPIETGREVRVPDGELWMEFDKNAGFEHFLLVVSNKLQPELNTTENAIPRDVFEERLAKVESAYRPRSHRSLEDGGWTKLFAARDKEDVALVVRMPLTHE